METGEVDIDVDEQNYEEIGREYKIYDIYDYLAAKSPSMDMSRERFNSEYESERPFKRPSKRHGGWEKWNEMSREFSRIDKKWH